MSPECPVWLDYAFLRSLGLFTSHFVSASLGEHIRLRKGGYKRMSMSGDYLSVHPCLLLLDFVHEGNCANSILSDRKGIDKEDIRLGSNRNEDHF